MIAGNSAGLLTFSQWLYEFTKSDSSSQDVPLPRDVGFLRLRRLNGLEAQISFETILDGSQDIFIYGTDSGLIEVAEIAESFAFSRSYERFDPTPSERRLKGDTLDRSVGPQGSRACYGWYIVGGARFQSRYQPKSESLAELKMFFKQKLYVSR